jgi:hypothetical protein
MSAAAEHPNEHGLLEAEFGCATAEVFHAPARTVLRLPVPRLGGAATECLFRDVRTVGEAHGFSLHEADDLLLGCSVLPLDRALKEATRDLYSRILAACAGRALYRIWNYVPAINAVLAGQENYRAFCVGRAQAFEAAHGAGFRHALPAASGVGCDGGALAVFFVAGRAAPRHIENPDQVSAYDYPREHGERSPSFARATIATHAGRPLVFLSGTAAIKGHATMSPDSLSGQLDCTLDNLRIIGRAVGVGESLGANSGLNRHFKAYLRHAADLASVRERLERDLLRPEDRVIYLRADICRAALNVEIEATLVG